MIKTRSYHPLLIFLAVGGLLIFFHVLGWLRPVENLLLFLTKPLTARLYEWGASYNRSDNGQLSRADLENNIASLTKQVADLTVANSQCAAAAAENKKLSDTLQFISAHNFHAVVASVIGRDTVAGDNRDLIVNRGARDGLSIGLGVIDESGAIIGKVVDLKDVTARICLITSPGCQLAAAFQNQDQTPGLTDGNLGLTVSLNYIPQLEPIAVGDLVITSGLDSQVARGLVIGRVSQVHSAANEVWQNATIEPLTNFNNLTVVSIIIP